MKYILALLLFICTKPSISQTLAIAIDNLNILHIGIKNTISIATSEGLDKDVIAEIEGAEGEIKKIGNGKYEVYVNQAGTCVIKAYVKDKLVGKTVFRAQNIPSPEANVGGYKSGEVISLADLTSQKTVVAEVRNSLLDFDYNVVSYDFICMTADSDPILISVVGSEFENLVRISINQHVKSGSTILFDNIKAKGPDNKIRKLPSLTYRIK
ncbi:MAG: hypothetical protein RL525_901 [Bacteroidota bacterium]|jgi:hypothetical protein